MIHRTNVDSTVWRGSIPVTNLYTAGDAGEDFLRALKDRGEILGSTCGTCKLTYVPARGFCERCMAELKDRTKVKETGVLESFTVCNRDLDGQLVDQPAIVATVKLDGASTPMLHFFLGTREQATIGARVKVAWKPASERTCSILDIRGFEPA